MNRIMSKMKLEKVGKERSTPTVIERRVLRLRREEREGDWTEGKIKAVTRKAGSN